MLKELDHNSIARMLNRTAAMDQSEQGDPQDDLDWCAAVLEALAQLRTIVADEISEGDPDMTTAFATDLIKEVDELIAGVTQLKMALDVQGSDPTG